VYEVLALDDPRWVSAAAMRDAVCDALDQGVTYRGHAGEALSYDEVGLLSENPGFLVRNSDGSEFQFEVIQSCAADGEEEV
jgi:hypothetical protein